MTEHETAGAHGREKLDLAQYRHAITRAPELIHHLAHLVVPGRYVDGQPTSRDLQAAPGRVSPLDEAEALFVWLWREAAAWIGHARLEQRPIGHMVRRDDAGRVIGSRRVISDETGAAGIHADATELVRIILDAWPTIETWYGSPHWGQAVGEQWAADVDRHLLRPLAAWPLEARAPIPERGRTCPACGEQACFTSGVDLDAVTAVCSRCDQVVRRETWMLVDEAAKLLGVKPRTIRDWMAAGLPAKPTSKGRMVELNAARIERDLREGRKKLGVPSAAGAC